MTKLWSDYVRRALCSPFLFYTCGVLSKVWVYRGILFVMQIYNREKKRLGKMGWVLVVLSPYILLGLLLLLNLFLQNGKHCPLPTVLEQDVWIFPSVVYSWLFYVIIIPFVEILLVPIVFILSGAYLSVKGIFKPEIRPAAWRRVFLGLPLSIAVVGLVLIGGLAVLAEYFGLLYGLVGIALILGLCFVVLAVLGTSIWLLVSGILEKRNKNKAIRKRGTRTIVAAALNLLVPFLVLAALVGFVVLGVLGMGSSSYSNSIEIPSTTLSTTSYVTGASYVSAVSHTLDSAKETIGFAVGGAKDIDNFRENVEHCYLPIPSDITYEGLFFDYQFDTENKTSCSALFCPQYEAAVLPDPFSKQDEYFLSVGLGSGLAIQDFARPPLDVVVVLDISGSMSSPFDRYYYDQFRNPAGPLGEVLNDWDTSKMEIAKEAVQDMVDHLRSDDRFGMVLFESHAERFVPFSRVGDSGHRRIQDQVATLRPRGGTNMEAGLTLGTEVLESLPEIAGEDRERRIIFLTDAMPNTGALEQNELYTIGKENAEKGIHTTFIGIGVDFNTELVELLTKNLRGANYFAVHSSSDFERRLDTEFEYLIAPLVYDLELTIEGGDYEIRTVYGSPEADKATGDILRVSSLFPSPTSEEGTRGGVILAHMRQIANTGQPTKVVVRYTDRQGEQHTEEQEVLWTRDAKVNPSANVRKAALLARYVNLMQNWAIDENLRLGPHEKTIYVPVQPIVFYHDGLLIPEERYRSGYHPRRGHTVPVELSEWERLSRSLAVSEDYRDTFEDFMDYFKEEYRGLNEQKLLKRELHLLDDLVESPKPRNGKISKRELSILLGN